MNRNSLPVPLFWTLLFAGVLSHLPALASWFVQEDFDFLARASGLIPTPTWPVRPWTTVILWKLTWPLFGLDAVAHHAVALMAFAGLVVASAWTGLRLGLTRSGAAVAGLCVALTPTAILPIAWSSASGEIWAALFAVLALGVWTREADRAAPALALVLGLLSLLAKESGLGLFAFFAAWNLGAGRRETPVLRRGRWVLTAVLAAAAVAVAWQVARAFSSGPLGAYALGGAATALTNLAQLFGRAVLPVPAGWLGAREWGAVGALALLLGTAHAYRRPLVRWALLWSLAALAPVLPLQDHLYGYYALPAVVGVAWWIGAALEGPISRWSQAPDAPPWRGGFALGLALVAVTAAAFATSQAYLQARDARGRLHDPILHRAAIAAGVRTQLSALIAATPTAPDFVALLQASRVEIPDEAALPPDTPILIGSPVYLALRGDVGLQLLLAEVRGKWVTSLDELPLNTSVLLDTGEESLRVLGPIENARIYAALIAVAAGQYSRARVDLWSAMRLQGATVEFAFDPDNLPITPEELDREATGFARFLEQDRSPTGRRLLLLFGQIYESVRGRELLVEGWGSTLRAPRVE